MSKSEIKRKFKQVQKASIKLKQYEEEARRMIDEEYNIEIHEEHGISDLWIDAIHFTPEDKGAFDEIIDAIKTRKGIHT